LAIVLGAVIGSALGEVIGLALPDGVVQQFFHQNRSHRI
jgi:hypothetical protein